MTRDITLVVSIIFGDPWLMVAFHYVGMLLWICAPRDVFDDPLRAICGDSAVRLTLLSALFA